MNRKSYHKPKILEVSKIKTIEPVQLAGVSPRAVIFLKSKLINSK